MYGAGGRYGGKRPLMTENILRQSREAESALADALVSRVMSAFCALSFACKNCLLPKSLLFATVVVCNCEYFSVTNHVGLFCCW